MKLSVIIPVYNAEAYLERCIKSVLSQKQVGYELILVDDGSYDQSPVICDRYAMEYSFIHVLHISNSGPATAKNRGYDIARGEYIYYADSDDELYPDMFDTMLRSADMHNADVVCCSYIQVDEEGNKSHEESTGKEFILNQVDGLRHLLEKNKIYSQGWTKIYRKEVIDKNGIRFIDGLKTEEDFIYNLHVFLGSKTIVIVDRPLYIYTHRESSLSRDYHKKYLVNFLQNMTYRLKMTDQRIKCQYPELAEACTVHCLQYYNLMIGRIAMCPCKESNPYYKQAMRYIKVNVKMLIKHHSRCGLSYIGALLCFVLPSFCYLQYRKRKI